MITIEEVGSAFLYHEPDRGWQVVTVDKDEQQIDLPDRFDTPGAALNALVKWATDRNLVVAGMHFMLRRVTVAD